MKSKFELILSLGVTPKQAIHKQLVESTITSTITKVEVQKANDLVQIMGMMSG